MKRLAAIFSALLLLAASAEGEPVLAGAVRYASFGALGAKATALGIAISNPILPPLLLGTLQQQLVDTYGRLRADSSIEGVFYLVEADSPEGKRREILQIVLYPAVEREATMILNHPGAEREADGSIHLLPSPGRPDDTWVVYAKDGRYAAFAPSAALARRALADIETCRPDFSRSPLAAVRLTQEGFDAWSKDSAPALARLAAESAALEAEVDVDAKGLTLIARLAAKPGTAPSPVAGWPLARGAMNAAPGSSPLFFASHPDFLPEFLLDAAAGTNDMAVACRRALAAWRVAKPDSADWSTASLAFDEAGAPYAELTGESTAAAARTAAAEALMDALVAICARRWPAAKTLVRTGAKDERAWRFDAGAATAAALCRAFADDGLKPSAAESVIAAAVVERYLKAALVETARRCEIACDAAAKNRFHLRFAGSDGKVPAVAGTKGEVRFASAMPEFVSKDRPEAVLLLTPYAFVRDRVLPVWVKCTDGDNAKEMRAMMEAMPPAEADGALVVALWNGKDASRRLVARLTAGELRALGAAFNAFTAATMSSAIKEKE